MKIISFFSKTALIASLLLTLAFIFSCSSDSPNNQGGDESQEGNQIEDIFDSPDYQSGGQNGDNSYPTCGGKEYSSATQFCYDGTLYPKCSGKGYNPTTHECISDILYSSFTDSRDSKKYKTVEIGSQVWMVENLNYNPPSGNSKCPDNSASNCTIYGRQYDWATAMSLATSYNSSVYTASAKHKGVCPNGWHIPSEAEWNTLRNYVGTNPGTKLKAKSGWSNNGNGTDNYGFAALPGGYVEYGMLKDSYPDIGKRGLWWTSNEYNGSLAYNRNMKYDGNDVVKYGEASSDYSWTKRDMLSIRCVKD